MALQTLNTIKQWFKTGLKPTQTQFWDTWDSFRHKFEKVPVKDIDGIDELLLTKADKTILDNHLADKIAHAPQINTDWNSESGFSQLLNKPEFKTINSESILGFGDIEISDNSLPVSATIKGLVDNIALQELGGKDKLINGVRIGRGNANHENNLVIGRNGLASITTGNYNVAIGNGDGEVEGPLQYLTTGNNNTMVGSDAGVVTTTGGNNTGIGAAALFSNATGSNNTALGAFALHDNSGSFNDAFGRNALRKNTTAVSNTAVGAFSLAENLTSPHNVAIGNSSLSKMASGLGQSTAIGAFCMSDATSTDKNAAIGTYALRYNTSGFSNTAIGHTALGLNTSGNSNNAVGNYSLGAITTGAANIGIGKFAGRYLTTGIGNIYVGSEGVASDAEANGIINIGNRFIVKGQKISLIGTLNIGTTPVYDDNATALAEGLTTGDIYRTATGILMITF